MSDYTIKVDDKFGQLHEFDVLAEADAVTEAWFNQTLTTVNDAVVRLGVVEGQFHWHPTVRADLLRGMLVEVTAVARRTS